MLQAIRDRATGWVAYTIVFLLVISFALWGISSYFSEPAIPELAEVEGQVITQSDFQRAMQMQRQRLQAMGLDPALFGEAVLQRDVLQGLVDEQVQLAVAEQLGLVTADTQLLDEIRAFPQFNNNGRFDPERYRQLLRSQGYSEAAFEQGLRRSLAASQLAEGIQQSTLRLPGEQQQLRRLLGQTRDFALLRISLNQLRETVELDEADIAAHYEEQGDRYTTPEQVRVEYIDLDQERIAQNLRISDEALQQAYDARRDSYRQSEERSASHILFTEAVGEESEQQAAAEQLRERLIAGELDFDQAMQEAGAQDGVEAGELGLITLSEGEENPFATALYALERDGDISAPVRSDFGLHLIRLDAIAEEQVLPLSEVEETLRAQLQAEQAEEIFYESADSLGIISHESPDSLSPAAETLGLDIEQSDWIGRNAGEGIGALAAVREAAFDPEVLREGFNSTPIEVSPTRLIVLRLLEHNPSRPLTLDEAREQITDVLRQRQAETLAAERAETALATLRSAETTAATLAEQEDAITLEQHLGIGREERDLDRALLNTVFAMPQPNEGETHYQSLRLNDGDQAVVQLQAVYEGSGELDPQLEARLDEIYRIRQQRQLQSLLDSQRRGLDVEVRFDRLQSTAL